MMKQSSRWWFLQVSQIKALGIEQLALAHIFLHLCFPLMHNGQWCIYKSIIISHPIITPFEANTSFFYYSFTPNSPAPISHLLSQGVIEKKSEVYVKNRPIFAIRSTQDGMDLCRRASLKQLVKVLQFLRIKWQEFPGNLSFMPSIILQISLQEQDVLPRRIDSLKLGWLVLGGTYMTPVQSPACPPNVHYLRSS